MQIVYVHAHCTVVHMQQLQWTIFLKNNLNDFLIYIKEVKFVAENFDQVYCTSTTTFTKIPKNTHDQRSLFKQ